MVRKKYLNSPLISLRAFFAASRRCGESFTFSAPWSVQFASMTYVVITTLLLVRGTAGTRQWYLRRWREKHDPDEVRVIRFEHHDRYKYQHQPRRQQDGIGQGQPLPGHVHEDGDDQASLQHHEQQDQRPSEIAMEAKVVDEIGAGAEDEQPSPDHEIELDRVLLALCLRGSRCDPVMHMSAQRMLLSFYVYRCVCHAPTSPKIKKGKDEHPHQIDEVPVQAGYFDDLVMPLPAREKAGPL